jgi:hypothetical protein
MSGPKTHWGCGPYWIRCGSEVDSSLAGVMPWMEWMQGHSRWGACSVAISWRQNVAGNWYESCRYWWSSCLFKIVGPQGKLSAVVPWGGKVINIYNSPVDLLLLYIAVSPPSKIHFVNYMAQSLWNGQWWVLRTKLFGRGLCLYCFGVFAKDLPNWDSGVALCNDRASTWNLSEDVFCGLPPLVLVTRTNRGH